MSLKDQIRRNDRCPCGSGKKFKKCCGLSVNQSHNKPDYFSINRARAVAYKGSVGRLREAFCIDYTTFKKKVILEIENELKQEVASRGKTISCSKGCSYCCFPVVVASLQDCECIVYYLYHNDEALENFIQAFSGWRNRILKIERCFRKIGILFEKVTSGQATDGGQSILDAELSFYRSQNIPCPFLVHGYCSIYEVRPFNCARVASSSPADWCDPSHPCHSQVEYLKAKARPSMPYLGRPQNKDIYSFMPLLVYQILEEGYDALSSLPGLEDLKMKHFMTL